MYMGDSLCNSSVFGTDDYEEIQVMYEEMTSKPRRIKLIGKVSIIRFKRKEDNKTECEEIKYSFGHNDYIVEVKE